PVIELASRRMSSPAFLAQHRTPATTHASPSGIWTPTMTAMKIGSVEGISIPRMTVDSPVMLALRFGVHSLAISDDRATEQNAAKVTTALAVCEYSHCVRNCSQLSRMVVQLLVA